MAVRYLNIPRKILVRPEILAAECTSHPLGILRALIFIDFEVGRHFIDLQLTPKILLLSGKIYVHLILILFHFRVICHLSEFLVVCNLLSDY